MKVTKLHYDWPLPYAISTDGVDTKRSKGLHLSDVIRATAIRMGYIDEGNGNALCCHLGIAWENYFQYMIKASKPTSEFLFHPEEYVVDGIAMSLDIIEVDEDGEVIVHDTKMSWKKPGQAPEKHWYWTAQLKSYCRAAGTLKGVLQPCYAAGYYQPPFPVYEPLLLEFTQRELEENWSMIQREAKSCK